jgi:hypothetical protein
MINVNWRDDRRNEKAKKYTDDWEDNHGRLSAFLTGWTQWANSDRWESKVLHWQTVGALYASCFASHEAAAQVPEIVRCQLYHTALMAYVRSTRCAHWTGEQRERALELSQQEIVRRGGAIIDKGA